MLGFDILSGFEGAIATVGVVLLEAIVLYVGYGALSSAFASAVIDAVGGD